MPQRTIRSFFLSMVAFVLVCAVIAPAQSDALSEIPATSATATIPIGNAATNDSWQTAEQPARSNRRIFVVTVDQPNRKQSCRVQSFTDDALVCSRGIGGRPTFLRQQVVALIVPGDDALRVKLVLGFNAGLGAAIWGTVVLAAACPACAVATGLAAFFCFGAAGATLIGDGQPERTIYLAPDQELNPKFGY